MPITALVVLGALSLIEAPAGFLDAHDMVWEVPPDRWIDGIPLGNGHIGAMVWGNGAPLKVTLDRYDAWDTRERLWREGDVTYAALRRMVAEGRRKEAEESLFTSMRKGPKPTRLPMPRVEIDFGVPISWEEARLSLRQASASIRLRGPRAPLKLQILTHARRNLILIDVEGEDPFAGTIGVRTDHLSEQAKGVLRGMGYDDPKIVSEQRNGYLHARTPSGYEYAVAWQRESVGPGKERIGVALASNLEAENPLQAAREAAALGCRARNGFEEHEAWWSDYWNRSRISIPEARLEALYYLEMYKLGSSTRPGGYPITLQGLWTLDGGMPPWSGDYHLDMNVQQTYWPIYTANRLELGEPLYRVFSDCLPRWRRQCREFFGFDGIWSGCAIGPRGERVWGYTGAELWPGNAAWLAHHYWLHFLYSRDRAFLGEKALPFMKLAFLTYANLLEKGPDGRLHVPLSHSPEWGEGSFDALVRDPTCDLALIRFLGGAIRESARVLGAEDEVSLRAREVLASLADYPQSGDQLQVSAGIPLSASHRHHSHLMGIYPLGVLDAEEGEGARALIAGSIAEVRSRGTGAWTGWSFPWMSLIASRAGYGNMAWQMLDLYARLFIRPNTLHVNGDPRRFGLTRFDYEPMTLEGGFGSAAAVMEMLLQSHRGKIRIFPSLPDHWHDAFFSGLRAEGAFLVTAKRASGAAVFVEIRSEAGEACQVHNPFPAAAVLEDTSADGSSRMSSLQGEVLRFPAQAGHVYLLYPPGKRPAAEERAPSVESRTMPERHYFGLKRLVRF